MKESFRTAAYAILLLVFLFLGWHNYRQSVARKAAEQELQTLLRKQEEAQNDPEFLKRQAENKAKAEHFEEQAKQLEAEAQRLEAELEAERQKAAKNAGKR